MTKTVKQKKDNNTQKAALEKPIKKAAAKKVVLKKPAAKKAAVKKTATKKVEAKKAAVKKTDAKKAAPKKVAAKKTSSTALKKSKILPSNTSAINLVKPDAKKIADKIAATTKLRNSLKKLGGGEFLALCVAQGMFEKKAEDIRILDLRNVPGASADFFVISHALNDKQVEAIARSVEEEVKKQTGQTPWHREGFTNLQWVLVDYIDVVAHVFLKETRSFYDIESLWGDAAEIPFIGK